MVQNNDLKMSLATTITDPLVMEFGRISQVIDSALIRTCPGSAIHQGLLERRAQVNRAWKAFRGN